MYHKHLALLKQIYTFPKGLKLKLNNCFVENNIDITIDQMLLLMQLYEEDKISQNQLAEKSCKNKSNITRMLDSLEKKGFIQRNPDPSDRRKFIIALTEQSKKIESKIDEIIIDIVKRIFEGISEDDIHAIIRVYKKMEDNI